MTSSTPASGTDHQYEKPPQGVCALAAHFEYLDDLRDSRRTNMFGAAAYLEAERGLERKEARGILKQWMETFDGSSSPLKRAAKAEARS